MVPDTRDETPPIGLGLSGTWVQLEPESEANASEFRLLESLWLESPAMGGLTYVGHPSFSSAMLVRDLRSGAATGIVANQRQPAGVATFLIFMDVNRSRVGHGGEASVLYIAHLFDSGARVVTAEVLSFNPANRVLTRFGFPPQARLREHAYSAGRFWDVIVHSFTRAEFLDALARHRHAFPGGTRKLVALGSSRLARS